jgi:hypothetical protein
VALRRQSATKITAATMLTPADAKAQAPVPLTEATRSNPKPTTSRPTTSTRTEHLKFNDRDRVDAVVICTRESKSTNPAGMKIGDISVSHI